MYLPARVSEFDLDFIHYSRFRSQSSSKTHWNGHRREFYCTHPDDTVNIRVSIQILHLCKLEITTLKDGGRMSLVRNLLLERMRVKVCLYRVWILIVEAKVIGM